MAFTTTTFQLSSGYILGYAEFGASDGQPVLYFHGLPASRLEASLWHQSALKAHVRLIASDRPGMGLSARQPERKLTDYASDIAELVDHLRLQRFRIIGVSGGGPYALACAADQDLSSRIESVAIVAGLPCREVSQAGLGLGQRFAYWAMDVLPSSFVGWFWDQSIGKAARKPDAQVLRKAVRQSFLTQGGEDAKIPDDNEVVNALTATLRAAFVQGGGGYADDATVISGPWGFKLESIAVPVSFWYGGKDSFAPAPAGETMAKAILPATFKCFQNDSHYAMVLKHQEEILAQICN